MGPLSSSGSPAQRAVRTARIALTLLVALLLAFAASPGARADFNVGSGGEGAGSGGTGSGSGNGGGSGSGNVGQPVYTYWTFLSITGTYGAVQPGCAATDSQGQANLGARFRYRAVGLSTAEIQSIVRRGDAAMAEAGVVRLEMVCLYPPSYVDRTEYAVIQSTANIEIVAPRTETLKTGTQKSAWGNGDHSLSALRNSKTQVNLGWTPSEVGQYRGHAETLMQAVTVRHWIEADPITGVTPGDAIQAIGGTFIANPADARGTQTCAGWVPDQWVSYDESACESGNGSGNPVSYTCNVPAAPGVTMNGQALNLTNIPRSGEPNYVIWEAPTFSSPTLVSIDATATRIKRSGTPWTDGALPTLNDVEIWRDGRNVLSSKDGTGWLAGDIRDWEFRATWASDKDMPTVLTPVWRWNATLMKNSTEIVSVDSDGHFVTRQVQVPIKTSLTCEGQPLSIQISRTISSAWDGQP